MDKKNESTTIDQAALDILSTSVYILKDLKSVDKEKYLKYAPGVFNMCIKYPQTF